MDATQTNHPFGEFIAKEHNPILGGDQYTFEFPNGYGASVIRHGYSYGGPAGLWELAVLDRFGELCYSTPITDDVVGHLDDFEVGRTLDQIAKLDPSDV